MGDRGDEKQDGVKGGRNGREVARGRVRTGRGEAMGVEMGCRRVGKGRKG